MNDEQHARTTAYIRTLADAMGLKDWRVTLGRQSADERAWATIAVRKTKNEAEIALCERWFVRTREDQRQTIVHELLHANTARLCRLVSRLKDEVGGETIGYVAAAFDEEEEVVIDALARVLAPFLPLPPDVA